MQGNQKVNVKFSEFNLNVSILKNMIETSPMGQRWQMFDYRIEDWNSPLDTLYCITYLEAWALLHTLWEKEKNDPQVAHWRCRPTTLQLHTEKVPFSCSIPILKHFTFPCWRWLNNSRDSKKGSGVMIWKLNTLTCSESMTRIPPDKKIRLLRETGSSRLLRTRNQLWYGIKVSLIADNTTPKRTIMARRAPSAPRDKKPFFEKSIFYSIVNGGVLASW